jgi:hypothetical protein
VVAAFPHCISHYCLLFFDRLLLKTILGLFFSFKPTGLLFHRFTKVTHCDAQQETAAALISFKSLTIGLSLPLHLTTAAKTSPD